MTSGSTGVYSVSLEFVLEKIGHLSSESSWTEIGDVLLELELSSAVDPKGVPWAQHVLSRLQDLQRPIAAQQLRKIRRCYAFLKNDVKVKPDLYKHCPLSGVEVVAKIFAIDRKQGRDQLAALKGGLPYTNILQSYEQLLASAAPKPLSASASERRNRISPRSWQNGFRDGLIRWLEDDPTAFFGAKLTRFFSASPKFAVEYQKTDLIFRFAMKGDDTASRYAALEIRRVGMVGPRERQALVAEVNLAASFYDIFWLILTDVRDGKAIAADLEVLGLHNVGLALLNLDGEREIVRRPSGSPFPDRRSSLNV
jgi:hypothetical protein